MRNLGRWWAVVVAVWAAACTSAEVPAGQCRYDADCTSPMVCLNATCRAPCATDADCASTQACARGAGGVRVCVARDAPRPCLYTSDCPENTVCTRDGVCQARCRGDYDCQVVNPFETCVAGACALVCPAGFADCDGSPRNGCEADLHASSANCGRCGTVCTAPDGAPGVCRDGACATICRPGFADCDGESANGCEADLAQAAHCGACATQCSGARGLCLAAREASTGARSYSCQPTCPAGTTMCGTRCVDLQNDPTACGGCEVACTAGPGSSATCTAGRCGVRCDDPAVSADCDGAPANGCEVELRRSVGNCGACGVTCPARANGAAACADGVCGVACTTGFGDCDGAAANGCETDLRSSAGNCGACGTACASRPNGASACTAGACASSCVAGYGDCDGVASNGCEVDTSATVAHCGACGAACAARAHAAAACASGTCRWACDAGWADCDGDPATGCEVELARDPNHCGACATACSASHGAASCSGGACGIACAAGFADCDGDVTNGCESDIATNALHCGGCRTVCSFQGAGARCDLGVCVRTTCAAGLGDCDGNAANGCETTLATSAANCGACGNVCVLAHATPACRAGACAIGACAAGWADCDGSAANGCEVALGSDSQHCGGCATACNATNGTATCAAGACGITCAAGWGNCDGSAANGCETNLVTTVASCGACGRACVLAHATAGCGGGTCSVVRCDAGWGDCDGNAANGCETDLTTSTSACGACGTACSLAHATAACRSGACVVGSCAAGWGDCDGSAANGCETNLATTVGACGACGRACSVANATPVCVAGACGVGSCAANFGDCDGSAANGCETDLRVSNGSCGRCGAACGAGTVCSGGVCGSVCGAGTTYCAGLCANLSSDVTHCGACATACPAPPNATPTCAAGACGFACAAGFANCDGNAANGCEASLASTTTCGACAVTCAPAHATAACVGGACAIAACAAGWGDCDGAAANGCETDLTANVTHCGTCATACSIANGTAGCRAGSCAVASCTAPWADCNAAPGDGCETNLGADASNCGACGTVCAAGTRCASARCVPVNDTCQTATVVDLTRGSAIDLPFTVVNGDHTVTTLTTDCASSTGADVFFQVTLTQTEVVYADTFGAGFDTVLFWAVNGLPRGGPCDPYILGGRPGEVWCNDDASNTSRLDVYTPKCTSGGTQSMVVGRFAPGTYYLAVAAYGAASGSGTVHLQHLPISTNGDVQYIPGTVTAGLYNVFRHPFVTPGTVATTCGGGAGPEDSYWWRSCPEVAAGVTFRANTCSTPAGVDTVLDLRHGTGDPGLCNDDAGTVCPGNSVASSVSGTLPGGAGIHVLTMDTYTAPAAGALYYLAINPSIIASWPRRAQPAGGVCLARGEARLGGS